MERARSPLSASASEFAMGIKIFQISLSFEGEIPFSGKYQKIMNSFSCQAPVDIITWWRLFRFFYIFDISPKFCQLSIVSCCHQFDLVPLSKIQNSKRKLKIKPPFGILETFHLQIMQAGIKPGRGCA